MAEDRTGVSIFTNTIITANISDCSFVLYSGSRSDYYRYGSDSRNLIFNGSVQVEDFLKLCVQVRFGFSCTKM